MRIAIIRTSSMGDIIHTLPVLRDIKRQYPQAHISWVCEQAFTPMLDMHPDIDETISIHWRAWRGKHIKYLLSAEYKSARNKLKNKKFDLIIDLHGVWKNLAWLQATKGQRWGYAQKHGSEWGLASIYNKTANIKKTIHATTRARQLAAAALNYNYKSMPLDYGLSQTTDTADTNINTYKKAEKNLKTVILVPDSNGANRYWPIEHWHNLSARLSSANYKILVAWGNKHRYEESKKIVKDIKNAAMLPWLNIVETAQEIMQADAVIAVDTGFAHLAVALEIPTLMLFGASNPQRFAAQGEHSNYITAASDCLGCGKNKCSLQQHNEKNNKTSMQKINRLSTTHAYSVCMHELLPQDVYNKFISCLVNIKN